MGGMAQTGSTPRTLKDWLEERRVEMDMTWEEFAERALMSREGLRVVRDGIKEPRTRTQRKIENAAGWTHGSIAAIKAGGEPTLAHDHAADPAEYARDPQSSAEELLLAHLRDLRRAGMTRDALVRVVLREIADEEAIADGDETNAAR